VTVNPACIAGRLTDHGRGNLMADGPTSNQLQALVDIMWVGSGTPRPATIRATPEARRIRVPLGL
jgi:hypothetical protein